MTAQDDAGQALYQRIGLIAGPIAALIVFLTFEPEGLSRAGVIVAALGLWMAIWWATEAIPVAVTAFLPLVVLPLLDVVPMRDIAAPYAHPIIYLFFGGFVVALAIERCGLHRRIALGVFAFAGADARAGRRVGACACACALHLAGSSCRCAQSITPNPSHSLGSQAITGPRCV